MSRAGDATPIRPTSALLTRWAQLTDVERVADRRPPRPTPRVVAGQLPVDPSPPSASRGRDRPAAISAGVDDPPLIRPIARAAFRPTQDLATPDEERLSPRPRAPHAQTENRLAPEAPPQVEVSVPLARTPAASVPVPPVERVEPSPPPHGRGQMPLTVPPPIERSMRPIEATRRVVQVHAERPFVLPVPPQAAPPLPPPARPGPTLEIGSIEVKVIREQTHAAAALPPQPQPVRHERVTSTAASRPASISRGISDAHTFHQS
jgi:hypothetical protein